MVNSAEARILDKEINKLLQIGIIEHTTHTSGECISPVFIRPKQNGYRMILKLLNEAIEYIHFKMEEFAVSSENDEARMLYGLSNDFKFKVIE